MNAVIHVNTHNSSILDKLATTCDRLVANGVTVVVVASDEGVSALERASGGDDAHAKLERLVQGGLAVLVCEATVRERELTPAPYCKRTPVGVVEVVRLQAQGYAYVAVSNSHYR